MKVIGHIGFGVFPEHVSNIFHSWDIKKLLKDNLCKWIEESEPYKLICWSVEFYD